MPKQLSQLSFQLNKIVTKQFATIGNSIPESKEVGIETNVQFGADNETKMISIFTMFKFESSSEPFIVLETGCYFRLENASWTNIYMIDTKEIIVPKDFLSHLVMISIGTARGILHAKTEGTPFNIFFLPTIDVSKLVTEDVKFSF